MRKRKWILIGSLAVVLVAVAWLVRRDTQQRQILLPDGRQFTVKAVTFGTRHRYVHAPAWARPLERFLPGGVKSRLGIRDLSYYTQGETLMVWGHWKFTRTNSPLTYASVVDRHGTESRSVPHQSSIYLPSFEAILGWNFSNYPRREKEIRMRLYQAGNVSPDQRAAVAFGNPAPARTQPWRPMSVPQTQADGAIPFVLTEFAVGAAMPPQWRLPYQTAAPWNTVSFQIRENGTLSLFWRVVGLTVSDASGNQADCRFDSMRTASGEIRCRFTDVLWPDEAAHKLTVEFVRSTNFVPTDLWTAPSVPVPAGLSPVHLSPNVQRHGVTLTSIELRQTSSGPAGPGAIRPTAHLVLRTVPAMRGIRPVLSHARDDRGGAVRFEEISPLQNGLLWFGLEIAREATQVDLTFALTRTHFIEFVARPSRPGAPPAADSSGP